MDLGTDINSEWVLTENGDLKLIRDEDNLAQSIMNRLTCSLDNLELYYEGYGSLLYGFLGWKKTDRTLDFMKIEIGNRLKDDPRIQNYKLNLSYNDAGEVDIGMLLYYDMNESVELNFVLNSETGLLYEG